MYHIVFIHSSVSRHLDCFYVLAILKSAAVNIGVHVFFSGYVPMNGIAESCSNWFWFVWFLFFKHNFLKFIFSWRKIALQCCVDFCHTTAWISHKYTYILSPPEPSSHHPLSLSSRSSQSPGLDSLCYIATSHWLSILHVVMYIFQCYSLSSFQPLLTPLCPQVHSLCVCFYSCCADRFISTIFLDPIYMH